MKSARLSRTPVLLPRELLVSTGPVDHAVWNYRGFLGFIQRRRFALVLRLLGSRTFDALLEVGYGSGVFLPELSKRCDQLFGIDTHPRVREVAAALEKVGVVATLKSGSVTALPFADGSFDGVVAVSTLEFVEDLATACRELSRVLKANGLVAVVTPGHSALLDLGLHLLTGESAQTDFADRRGRVEPTLGEHFEMLKRVGFPPFALAAWRLYRAYLLRRR
jgi:ubiquinone/menaquinone biosynthesis C-methylase UbiE